MKYQAVAIDGPSGAGKSTMAKAVAETLRFIYVDTGALYRAIGTACLARDISTNNEQDISRLLTEIKIGLDFVDGEQRVFLNDEDVSERIRTPEAAMAASNVSAFSCVRAFLFDLQRQLAQNNNVVMDGRDIGTVVLPTADVKIFLTATPEDRTQRRLEQFEQQGQQVAFEDLLAQIKQRDYNDSHRAIAPLKQAQDAVLVDTTGNTLEQSIRLLCNLVTSKLQERVEKGRLGL